MLTRWSSLIQTRILNWWGWHSGTLWHPVNLSRHLPRQRQPRPRAWSRQHRKPPGRRGDTDSEGRARRLERRHASPSSEVDLPAHRTPGPLVCIISKYQKRPRAYRAGRQPPAWPTLPRWPPPRGSLSCDSFTEMKPSCLGQPRACISLLFKFSLREKCEVAKSIPLEMLSN